MRKLYTLLFISLSSIAFAQWDSCGVTNNLNNRQFETINSFIVHQGRLFAHNVMTGLLYSDDDGNSWTTVNDTFNGAITFLYELDQKIYASTAINGVVGGYQYYSSDKGISWTIDTAGMPSSAVNANYPASVIKAEQMGDYFFYQFNIPQAFQWRHKDSSVYHSDAFANVNQLSGWDIENDTLWGLLGGRIQYLSQAKSNFTIVPNNDLPIIASAHVHKSGNRFFIAALDANLDWTLYRSTNYGLNWDTVQLQPMLGIGAFGLKRGVNLMYIAGNEVWLGPQSRGANTRSQIMTSPDGGDTWLIDSLILPMDDFGSNAVRVFQKTTKYMFAAYNFRDVFRKMIGNVGLEETQSTAVELYPNPSQGPLALKANFQIREINLLNLNGKILRSWEGSQNPNIQDLAAGIYLIEVIGQKGESHRIRVSKP